ncbi:hypothetical protein C0995_001326 [Termitomyces sp. Mi166|nr:hypothetical protein C0995_001326 [Termitomyces sp. Mi166\
MATCHDPEGWRIVSRVREFDATLCFEEGVLLSTLLAALLVVATARSLVLAFDLPRERTRKSWYFLNAKLVSLVASFIVSVSNLFFIVLVRRSVPVIYSYFIEPIALASALSLTYLNHTRTRTSSSTLLIFWPLYLSSLATWTRSVLLAQLDDGHVILALKSIVGGLGLISFALEIFGPEYDVVPTLGDKLHMESPLNTANIFSVWTFGWMTSLMKKGASQFITETDLPSLQTHDESENLGKDLENALKKHTLWKALFIAYGGPYAVAAILKVFQDCLAFLQPQLLRWLLSYISWYQSSRFGNVGDGPSSLEGFAIAGIMFLASVAQTVALNQYFQRTFETGMRVRAGLVTVIYAKALVLSNDERSRASGDIVNLMSVDATRLQDLCTYGLIALSGPLQITLAFISLYNLLGWSAFVGVGIMIFSIPLNTCEFLIARTLKRMQEQQMKNRDKRTRLMSELLANIKSIKLYAWEYSFMRKIFETRNNQELKMLRKIGLVTAFNTTLWSGIPLLVGFSSFATAAAMSSKPLTSDIIFPAISLFMLLQFPLAMFSQVTSNIIEAIVSVKRLSDFLNAEELQADARKFITVPILSRGDEVLSVRNADFSWEKKAMEPTLEGINLSVKKGGLVGVFGRVGAGKASGFSLACRNGSLNVRVDQGSIAYAPQNPWILSATVRENILFSHEYDETFYNLVIEACALGQDLSLLPQGDLTQVGEKGITLSGGQRARISLARAVYARADLVLLDDCLAAVDSHVARHVFDNVIGPHGLLATKARILVTNSIAFVKQFDQLVFVRRGIILESGSYETLTSNTEGELSKLLRGHGSSSSSGTSTPFVTNDSGNATPSEGAEVAKGSPTETEAYASSISEKLRHRTSFTKARIAKPGPTREVESTGLSKEHQEQGRVKVHVYKQYIEAASKAGFFFFLFTTVLQQAASVLANFTLRDWGEHNREAGSNQGMLQYLVIYGIFSFSSTLLGGVSSVLIWVLCALRSAKRLHDGGMCRTLAVCLSIVVVIGASFPPFLVAIIPLGFFYGQVMKYYLATSRELKRLDAVSRSPIFAWFSESLAGLSTIRAFNQQSLFISVNQHRIDRNQICYLPSISVNRWLAVRLEFVGAMIILIVALLAMTALITTGVDAGLVGLVLSYALNTTSSLNWVVRSASEVEQNIVSVERILHQTEVQPEAPQEIPENKPSDVWPSHGEVEFRRYSTRYRPELDFVLKDISLVIKPKEKIGVCGRTGAGKSSVGVSAPRIGCEPAEGTILIDSVDITTVGLHDLRSNISIVPQSPDLFEGSLRENIDPVGEHTDADIWTALGQAHLKDYVDTLPQGLDAPVREGGSSLSSGQRQLLCFARALLRKSKILVLDEATSAVDLDTDRAIQEIIRGSAFADVTMFTIAHRLNTIIESDRVLVMDSGKVAEFDTPEALLANRETVFYSLAQEAGLVNNGSK